MKNQHLFSDFTNQYPLSKTLRFELKPIGKDGKPLEENQAASLLSGIREKDKEIKEAYIALKPVMDKIHENVINASLTSNEAKQISFSDYYEKYKKKENLDSEEKTLRGKIVETYKIGIIPIKEKAGKDKKGNSILKKNDTKCLSESGILKYIENNFDTFVTDKLPKEGLRKQLEIFKRFFTYFSGYNQNRENYYSKEEKSTAVATRIVHDNLPKFCENWMQLSQDRVIKKKKSNETITIPCRKDEYLSAYQYLKNANKTTQIKDAETNKMIEAYPIEEKMFDIANFYKFLPQSGIEEYNRIIGHYNLLINLYNQARKDEPDFRKLDEFKTLYKQIGCGEKKVFQSAIKYNTRKEQDEKESTEEILNLKETLKNISFIGQKYLKKATDSPNVINIYNLIEWLKNREDWDGVYWSKAAVNIVSNKYLANWYDIKNRLKNYKECASFNKKREEQIKINDAVELSGLFEVLNQNNQTDWSKILFKESVWKEKQFLIDENLAPSKNLINLICADIEDFAKVFCDKSEDILKLINYKNEDNKLAIKEWLDTAISIIRIVKYFLVKESKIKGNAVDSELSNMLSAILNADDAKWFDWYDAVRNYLTKKPQDDAKENKLKLNFEKGNLLDGFVDSHSDSDNATQYGGYLFRKKVGTDYEYFLGTSQNSKLFRCHLQKSIQNNDKSEFERLEYYQAKGTTYFDNKYNGNKLNLIKKVESVINEYVKDKEDKIKNEAELVKKRDSKGEITPSKLFDNIKKKKEFVHILSNENVLSMVNRTIQDLKISCNNFIERAPKLKDVQGKEYSGIEGYKQIIEDLQTTAKENKVFNFFNVSQKEFDSALSDEKRPIYLFKISNKDLSFSETSQKDEYGKQKRNLKGTENLHTLFFRALMREYDNCNSIDLGKGEIFFRDKAIPKPEVIHFANKPIYRRSDGKTESIFTHNIIKDKRFTETKYQLHLSISLNFNPTQKNVTEEVNDKFTQTDDIQFLGIDRGEKHLIYYSLIDVKGNIIEQNHFDVINKKDYLQAINKAAKERKEKRQNWQEIGNIKNLKDGYMSLVVHEIIEKMKDKETGVFKPTFIVLEDLNTGFKRSRQKFEQQVYQKFELALAKKLNYLVDKNAKMGEIGSVAKALQLTPPVANYQDIENKKQVGIMLYTRANYTSITDPATGWRKTIYLKKGSEVDIQKKVIDTFSEIGIDNGDYFFQYTDKKNGNTWKLWSGKDEKSLERYRYRRGKGKNEGIIESYNVKEMLDKLFKIFDKKKSLLEQIKKEDVQLAKINENTAWESLRFVIDIIQQIRNSGDINKKQDDNFLQSPVRDENGYHFDSRFYQKQENSILPKDADANGAYNIARKGLIMYEHIKLWQSIDNTEKKNLNLDLFISDEEWDLWLFNKQQWEKQLQVFVSKKQNDTKNLKS